MQHEHEQVKRRDERPNVANVTVQIGNARHNHRDVYVKRGNGGAEAGDLSMKGRCASINDACVGTHDQCLGVHDQCVTAQDQCQSTQAASRSTQGLARPPPRSPRSVEHADWRFEALSWSVNTRCGWREGRDAPVQDSLIASTHS